MERFNFNIDSDSTISQLFKEKGLTDFTGACNYIKSLSYKRNQNKYDPVTVIKDQYGTCSTKHALLCELAIENKMNNVKLILGVFRMNKKNTPQVTGILKKYNLDHIPEAHNYLSINNQRIDCTMTDFDVDNFSSDLISEIEILPRQITDFKVTYHKQLLQKWLTENPEITLSLEEIWKIREECIEALVA